MSPAQDKAVFLSYYSDKDVGPTADPDSPFWKGIRGVFIEKSVLGPDMPQFRAEVRSRWTKDHVYFLFIAPYEKLTLNANPDSQNETYRLWEKDCFEWFPKTHHQGTKIFQNEQRIPIVRTAGLRATR
jgi:hypothetical protein